MATLFGENATLRDSNVPSDKIRVQDNHGRLRVARDKISLSGALALNDKVVMMELPAGAKVYEMEISTDDLGTTGVLDVGWAASSEGGEAADQNGFYGGLDVATAANARLKISNGAAGFLKKFSEKVQVEILATTATDAAGDIELIVYYVVD